MREFTHILMVVAIENTLFRVVPDSIFSAVEPIYITLAKGPQIPMFEDVNHVLLKYHIYAGAWCTALPGEIATGAHEKLL